jgi:hypothetical protein
LGHEFDAATAQSGIESASASEEYSAPAAGNVWEFHFAFVSAGGGPPLILVVFCLWPLDQLVVVLVLLSFGKIESRRVPPFALV